MDCCPAITLIVPPTVQAGRVATESSVALRSRLSWSLPQAIKPMLSEAVRAIAKMARERRVVFGFNEKSIGTSLDYGIPRAVARHEMPQAGYLLLESLRFEVFTVKADRRS